MEKQRSHCANRQCILDTFENKKNPVLKDITHYMYHESKAIGLNSPSSPSLSHLASRVLGGMALELPSFTLNQSEVQGQKNKKKAENKLYIFFLM